MTERQRTAGSEPAGSGTSESQLVRYFGGKAGLLDAIFDEAAFDRDDELATLFLFEGRRIRGESKVRLSAGFVEFNDVAQRLIRRGQKDGSFSSSFDATALSAALMGAVEATVRERLLAKRGGNTRPFSDKQLHKIFAAMLDGFS